MEEPSVHPQHGRRTTRPIRNFINFLATSMGQIYVGFMSVFHLRHPQSVDIHLATSRDGLNFTRVCRGEPFIPSGPLGYYDYMAMACSQPEPSSSTTLFTSITRRPTFRTAWMRQVQNPASQGQRGAGHVQARPVCLPGNER